MTGDLFSYSDECRRERLRTIGWRPAQRWTQHYWLRPDGQLVTEAEAFKQLSEMEGEKEEGRP